MSCSISHPISLRPCSSPDQLWPVVGTKSRISRIRFIYLLFESDTLILECLFILLLVVERFFESRDVWTVPSKQYSWNPLWRSNRDKQYKHIILFPPNFPPICSLIHPIFLFPYLLSARRSNRDKQYNHIIIWQLYNIAGSSSII